VSHLEIRSIPTGGLTRLVADLSPIRGYSKADRPKVEQYIRWWLFENPSGEGVQAAMYDRDTLAGIACITPKVLRVNGQPACVAEIGGTETSKAYQGRGIFSSLVQFLLGEAERRGWTAVYGTPNEASGRIYLGKLGFTALFHWTRSIRPVNWSGVAYSFATRRPNVATPVLAPILGGVGAAAGAAIDIAARALATPGTVTVTDRPAEGVAGLVEGVGPAVSVHRTASYLAWRYARPDRSYRHLHLRDASGELRGWAAYAHVDEGQGRSRVLVGDYWVRPWTRGWMNALTLALRAVAKRSGLSEIYASSRSRLHPRPGATLGFVNATSSMPVILKTFARGGGVPLVGWDYRDSDADMF